MAFEPKDLVGKIVGGCRIVSLIGAGGMGAVYEAFHLGLEKKVAVKVLLPGATRRPDAVKRFLREAKAAARLDHPNIVQVLNVGLSGGEHFIVMQLVEGEPLGSIVERKEMLPPEEASAFALQAAAALEAAHLKGVIHRDVKPDNMLVTPDKTLKMTDFGLATLADKASSITSADSILGTPYFMSPEQCRGEPADERSDVYSLGATFYYLLTGVHPFSGESVMATLMKHINEPPVPPSRVVSGLPAGLSELVVRMMAKDPADRPKSMPAVRESILDIFPGLSKDSAARALPPAEKSLPSYALAVALAVLALGAAALAVAVFGVFLKGENAEAAFERAAAWARERPADHFGQAMKFEEFSEDFPRSPLAEKARAAAVECRAAGVAALRAGEKAAIEAADALIGSGEFEKAESAVSAFASSAPPGFEVSRRLTDTRSAARAMAKARALAGSLEYGKGAQALRDAARSAQDATVSATLESLAGRFESAAAVHERCGELADDLYDGQAGMRGKYFLEGEDAKNAAVVFASWRTLKDYFELQGLGTSPVDPFATKDLVTRVWADGKARADGSQTRVEEAFSWALMDGRWVASVDPVSSGVVKLAVESRVADLVRSINSKDVKHLISLSHLPQGTSREDLVKIASRLLLTSALIEIEGVRIDRIKVFDDFPGLKASGVQSTRVRKTGHRSESAWNTFFVAEDGTLKIAVTTDPRFR